MTTTKKQLSAFDSYGFTIIPEVYTAAEIATLVAIINKADVSGPAFRKTAGLFAIRQFLKELPATKEFIFNKTLLNIIRQMGNGYFVAKAIYFDKPEQSNWFVAWHQDLTISVNQKTDTPGFGPWTVKQDQYAVQPPLSVLENNFTIRIHLDDTDENNGALKVIPGSHLKGVYRPETIDWTKETAISCDVKMGGIMVMRPLLLHASSRSTNHNKRRVIHIEFSCNHLPAPLQWAEYCTFPQ